MIIFGKTPLMKNRIYTIISVLFAAELLYSYLMFQEGTVDLTGAFGEFVIISFFVGLFFAGVKWSRWVAIVIVALMLIGCTAMAIETGVFLFYIASILYGTGIYFLSTHKLVVKEKSLQQEETGIPVAPSSFNIEDQVFKYPTLLKRYQSLLIDFAILFAIMIVTMIVMGASEYRQVVMLTLGGVFIFIYEPFLTTYSATIGQRIMGIRIRRIENPNERINLLHAYFRLLVKWMLGWLSFITINFNPQHRAIHDMAGSSVAIKL
jgi:uncharacterized RDD family membrane protein YckC